MRKGWEKMKCRVVEIQFRDILTEGDGQTVTFTPSEYQCRKMTFHDEGDRWAVYMYDSGFPLARWVESYKYNKDVVKDVLITR